MKRVERVEEGFKVQLRGINTDMNTLKDDIRDLKESVALMGTVPIVGLDEKGPSMGGGLNLESEEDVEALKQVVREVLEETGVRTEFDALVCFRHWHGYRYGKSDIYFVCRLRPLTEEVTIQAEEISEALWMPVDEYLEAVGVSVFNKEIVKAAIKSPGVSPVSIKGYSDPEKHEIFMPRSG